MHKAVRRVGRSLGSRAHNDLSNLSGFEVVRDGEVVTGAQFVLEVRERHRAKLCETDITPTNIQGRHIIEDPSPEDFRPTGQTGLEQFAVVSDERDST